MSDPHYNHKNICSATSEWVEDNREKATRKFASLPDMNKALIEGINDNVKEEALLFNLGDWSFGGIGSIWEFRKQIKCKEIHSILGNHDHHLEEPKILHNLSYIDGKIVEQPSKNTRQIVHTTDLFASTQYVKTITVKDGDKKYQIFMSHYAHLVWDKSHKGALHLFGHSHTSINHMCVGKSMDTGVDNAFLMYGKYRPFNLRDEIIPILNSKPIHKIDHH